MNRAARLVNTGDHVELSRGYPALRVAVTYEDDPGWLHERLMLWVVEPDRFVVLTPDGDMYEEMRETWRSAQIVTGRRRFPNRPWKTQKRSDTSLRGELKKRKCILPGPSQPVQVPPRTSIGVVR